jgi:hypothetical protein
LENEIDEKDLAIDELTEEKNALMNELTSSYRSK